MKYIIDTDKLPCNNGQNCTSCPFWSIDDSCEIREQVKRLPKYEERPHGEWIPCKSTRNGQVTNIDYKCSNCSHHKDRPVPYCEICGAKMKRSEKE